VQVVLLTPEGNILDTIRCRISERYGLMETDIRRIPNGDGAMVVIRLVGFVLRTDERTWGHNWHEITFRGETNKLMAHPSLGPDIWDREGLVRMEIADAQFGVLFPRLEAANERPARPPSETADAGRVTSRPNRCAPPPPTPLPERERGIAGGAPSPSPPVVEPKTRVVDGASVSRPSGAGTDAKQPADAPPGPAPDWNARDAVLSASLADLARREGQEPGKFDKFPEASAQKITSSGKTYVLTLQYGTVFGDTSVLNAMIWTVEGKLLDRIRCETDKRYGILRWDFHGPNQIILTGGGHDVRDFTAPPYSWHYWHAVVFRNKRYTFWSEEGRFEHNLRGWPTILRGEIRDGKFVITSPRLESPQDELGDAQALRIGYAIGPDIKYLRIENPEQVKAIVSTMTVKGTEPGLSIAVPANATVNFLMPNGASIRTTFVTRTTLDRAHWGHIHLASSAFYDAISSIASKAEGKQVNLIEQ
jgi:hypothetical protein